MERSFSAQSLQGIRARIVYMRQIQPQPHHLIDKDTVRKSHQWYRALTRPYWSCLTTPCQLKLAEYFPNWASPKFLNPIKLRNKYYWFFVHIHGYKLQFDYDHLLITILH